MAAVLRANTSFAVSESDGSVRIFNPGDVVLSDDPVVKGRENHFEPVEVAAGRFANVEEATAEPGVMRKRGRPAKAVESEAVEPAKDSEEK
jgi:hypothetical protein